MLASHLPEGTPVVGCAVAGLMGIDENGQAFEIDPQPGLGRARKGVTVLLGHLTSGEVKVFADTLNKVLWRAGS